MYSPQTSKNLRQAMQALREHLRFKQAQPKMCHSPKVEDGYEN